MGYSELVSLAFEGIESTSAIYSFMEQSGVSTIDLSGPGQAQSNPPPPKMTGTDSPNWQDQDAVLREMWMRNQTPAAIAEALGRSVPAIMTRAARLGLPRRFAPGRKPGRRPAEATDTTKTMRSGTSRTKSEVSAVAGADVMSHVSTRICLMCLDKFQSMGRHNRICPTCKNSAEYESASRLPDLDFPVGDP